MQSDPFFSEDNYLGQSLTAPERANVNKKCSHSAKLSTIGLWWFAMKHLGKSKPENATSPPMTVNRVEELNCSQKSQNRSMVLIFGMPFGNFWSEPF